MSFDGAGVKDGKFKPGTHCASGSSGGQMEYLGTLGVYLRGGSLIAPRFRVLEVIGSPVLVMRTRTNKRPSICTVTGFTIRLRAVCNFTSGVVRTDPVSVVLWVQIPIYCCSFSVTRTLKFVFSSSGEEAKEPWMIMAAVLGYMQP